MTGLVDGLGGEELGQAGSQPSNLWLTGSVVSQSQISGLNLFATGSLQAPNVVATTAFNTTKDVKLNAGSPYGYGLVIPMTARSAISGGMWVSASGGLAVAGPASVAAPIGVAQPGTNVASGGTVNVVVVGVVPMISEGTVAQGEPIRAGAGGALNCVLAVAAGSASRFSTFDAAASGGTVFVLVR